jgi:hypothetical protein
MAYPEDIKAKEQEAYQAQQYQKSGKQYNSSGFYFQPTSKI